MKKSESDKETEREKGMRKRSKAKDDECNRKR
jgi:hypothetical protein